jgi:hypothetical protein
MNDLADGTRSIFAERPAATMERDTVDLIKPEEIANVFSKSDNPSVFDLTASTNKSGREEKRSPVSQREIDTPYPYAILTAEETARFLHKSLSWVYKHWRELGGVKLGGSLIFPSMEDLYEHLFGKREGLPVRLHSEGGEVHGSMVQNEKGRSGSRGKKKGGNKKSEAGTGRDADRHNLLGVG